MSLRAPLEILVRLKCSHSPAVAMCLQCEGYGYLERWMRFEELRTLPTSSWIILGKRCSRT